MDILINKYTHNFEVKYNNTISYTKPIKPHHLNSDILCGFVIIIKYHTDTVFFKMII